MSIQTIPTPKFTAGLLARIFVPFALGYFLSYLYRVVNAVIAPDLVRDTGINAADLGLLTSAYFLTFAAAQLPLGILLDRFGPRKTEATLLVFAALGAFVFATADGLSGLLIGRALIGFGVSACLMAAFKAFVTWFPVEKLPMINGIQMASGGLGALSATAPIEAALAFTDWRGVFMVLAATTLIVAAIVWFFVPHRGGTDADAVVTVSLVDQIKGTGEVFKSPLFWSIAPLAIASQATFIGSQSLWAGPWLRDVAGYGRAELANTLFLVAGAMVIGFLTLGALAERLSRRGISPITFSAAGLGIYLILQFAIVFEWTNFATPIWVLCGFFSTSAIISYAGLSQRFPTHLAGRVNTSINLLIFIGIFAAQWAIGAIIGLWPEGPNNTYDPAGYQTAFAIMLALQAVAFAWFIIATKRIARQR